MVTIWIKKQAFLDRHADFIDTLTPDQQERFKAIFSSAYDHFEDVLFKQMAEYKELARDLKDGFSYIYHKELHPAAFRRKQKRLMAKKECFCFQNQEGCVSVRQKESC